jgi:hypothetical protein
MLPMSSAKPAAGLLIAIFSLLLGACLFSPGKFVSTLDIRRDGAFTYSYTGEIYLLALSKIAEMNGGPEKFTAKPCYSDDNAAEKPCTATDLADQKSAWEAERRAGAARRKREADQMKAVFGGIDMSNPRAAEEIAARLRRQAGWRRVDYKGDGLFDVDFSLTGSLDHDFTFPTVEQFPMANSFIQISRRKDGVIRIDAPGFGPGPGGEPFRSLSKGALMDGEKTPDLPVPDGRFTLTTDAAILANNTDDGPQTAPNGQALVWTVNVRSGAAPMALVRLGAR